MDTTNFKGLQIDSALASMLPCMDSVNEYRESLQRLQSVWDSLALLGQMSGVATDINTTRKDFHLLTEAMVESLARRALTRSAQAMGAKAQVVIDILVRNLFERTADVGFLATDPVLGDYAQQALGGDLPELHAQRLALQDRFADYVAKYSVYDDIIVLSPTGRVLARLDTRIDVEQISESVFEQALQAGTPFVETFGESPLLGGRRGLLYCAAIPSPNGSGALGVLCLSFRFDNEMQGIFAHLDCAQDRSVTVLLDDAGRVLVSSDPWQIPLGAVLPTQPGSAHQTLYFAGRDYLAVTRQTIGYQGYNGPAGWQACVLSPLEFAFRSSGDQAQSSQKIDLQQLAGALDNQALFEEELREVPRRARRIQRDLERSVWNGRVLNCKQAADEASTHGSGASITSASAFASVLLREVATTGERIKDVFERAICSLQASAMASVLEDMRFRASLAIDIQDRNLYERANDCRWWAMNPVLRETLAEPARPDQAERATQVLQYIHSLYTVYALLLIFDREGRVVAVSRPQAQDWVGRRLDTDWVRDTLALRDNQAYTASRFEPSPLYGDQHALIYGAAVFTPSAGQSQQQQQACGGIAIVFDTAPQLAAMLHDCRPAGSPCISVFMDRTGQVQASSDARFPVGSRGPLVSQVAALGRGQSQHVVTEIDGMFYAAGLCQSAGYREYRSENKADDRDVAAIMLMPLCATDAHAGKARPSVPALPPMITHLPPAQRVEIASFLSGGQWLGIPADQVIEAVEGQRLTAVPNAPASLAGLLSLSSQLVIPVLDLGMLRGAPPSKGRASSLIVVCKHASGAHLGLLVDELAPVFEVALQTLQPIPSFGGAGSGDQLLRLPAASGETPTGRDMLILLALEPMLDRLGIQHNNPIAPLCADAPISAARLAKAPTLTPNQTYAEQTP